jgi:hypothetical protein
VVGWDVPLGLVAAGLPHEVRMRVAETRQDTSTHTMVLFIPSSVVAVPRQ